MEGDRIVRVAGDVKVCVPRRVEPLDSDRIRASGGANGQRHVGRGKCEQHAGRGIDLGVVVASRPIVGEGNRLAAGGGVAQRDVVNVGTGHVNRCQAGVADGLAVDVGTAAGFVVEDQYGGGTAADDSQ